MPSLEHLNSLFHLVSFFGLSAFIIFLYGRASAIVHAWPRGRSVTLKAALSLVCGGHLMMALAANSVSETALNAGSAGLWVWAAVFHWQHFVKRSLPKADT
jgi:hypothetical protein